MTIEQMIASGREDSKTIEVKDVKITQNHVADPYITFSIVFVAACAGLYFLVAAFKKAKS